MSSTFAYVGCLTSPERKGRGNGINVFRMNEADGRLSHVQLLAEFIDPSFLTLDRSGSFLYVVNASAGEISAFAIDKETGKLSWLNTQPSGGKNPVALCPDPSNRFLLTVNYSSGEVAVLPTSQDGRLEPPSQVIQLEGKTGPDPVEQAESHPHHITFDAYDKMVLVPDKGFDKIFVFDFEAGKLSLNERLTASTAPGAGPRHIAFNPGGAYAYVINELDSTVTTFMYGPGPGVFRQLQSVSSLPNGFAGENTGSEIVAVPSGRFVYGSNRGHNSLVVYAVDSFSRQLTPLEWVSTQGETPRFFTLDPSGNFLYALNQDNDSLVTFRVDQATGSLSLAGQVLEIGSPVCMVFARF